MTESAMPNHFLREMLPLCVKASSVNHRLGKRHCSFTDILQNAVYYVWPLKNYICTAIYWTKKLERIRSPYLQVWISFLFVCLFPETPGNNNTQVCNTVYMVDYIKHFCEYSKRLTPKFRSRP